MCNLSPKQIVREDEKEEKACECVQQLHSMHKSCSGTKATLYCPVCLVSLCEPCCTLQTGSKGYHCNQANVDTVTMFNCMVQHEVVKI